MLPYLFSAFTIRSVGKAAFGMVAEVRRQIRSNPGILQGTAEPDYKACIKISTRASLKEMIAPGALVNLWLFRLSFLLFSWDLLLGLVSWQVSCLEPLLVEFRWLFRHLTLEVLGITPRNISKAAQCSMRKVTVCVKGVRFTRPRWWVTR